MERPALTVNGIEPKFKIGDSVFYESDPFDYTFSIICSIRIIQDRDDVEIRYELENCRGREYRECKIFDDCSVEVDFKEKIVKTRRLLKKCMQRKFEDDCRRVKKDEN